MNQIREVVNNNQLWSEIIHHPQDVVVLLKSTTGRRYIMPFRCPLSPERTQKEQIIVDAFKQIAQANLGISICSGLESSFPVCLQCSTLVNTIADAIPSGEKVVIADVYSKNLVHNRAPLSLGDN